MALKKHSHKRKGKKTLPQQKQQQFYKSVDITTYVPYM